MIDKERLAAAEEFVRKAVAHFPAPVSEEEIKEAARKAARALPPFKAIKKGFSKYDVVI